MKESNCIGRVHSIQSLGTLDGPGIRFVVFTAGCILRCIYCHNPDSQSRKSGQDVSADVIVEQAKRYKSYYGKVGGITISGGEPLLQPDFVTAIFQQCQKEGIHTALDTSGVGIGKYKDVLEVTDLVILDIKAGNEEEYQAITRRPMAEYQWFKQEVLKQNKELWLRHVVVPGINDTEEDSKKIAQEMNEYDHVTRIEILPFTNIGAFKYRELNLPYTLYDKQDMTEDEANRYRSFLKKYLKPSLKETIQFTSDKN